MVSCSLAALGACLVSFSNFEPYFVRALEYSLARVASVNVSCLFWRRRVVPLMEGNVV